MTLKKLDQIESSKVDFLLEEICLPLGSLENTIYSRLINVLISLMINSLTKILGQIECSNN